MISEATPQLLLELHQYLTDNRIDFTSDYLNVVTIEDKEYFLVQPKEEGKVISEEFTLLEENREGKKYVFKFGNNWWYSDSITDLKFNPLKYLGKAKIDFDPLPFLGIHSKYEILSGSRDFKDWCKKAKFLQIDTLGICEKNSLSGTLAFQLECKKQGLNSILGATYTIDYRDSKYDLKVYVENEKGWENILQLNKICKIDNLGYIPESEFLKYTEGLIIVVDPKSIEYREVFRLELNLNDNVFYQLDTVEYVSDDRDKWYLENLKQFVKGKGKPVIITDAFYLEKEDAHIKKKLNIINNKSEYEAKNQYFKCFDDYLNELVVLFNSEDPLFEKILGQAIENTNQIKERCKFSIPTSEKHLPKYIMRPEEKEKFETNEDLFWHLIEKGLEEKVPVGEFDKYLARVEEEVEVIRLGNLIDYFLINWDQMKFCRENNLLYGLGRGSGAASLCGHLLDLTKINPLDYNLPFSRFLTKSRAVGSLPDLDCDFMQERKDEIKDYHRAKYGKNQCCSVGAYTTLQLKGAFKELCRFYNVSFATSNDMSKYFTNEDKEWQDIFKIATQDSKFKTFVQNHFDLVNDLRLILGSIKAESVHASAFIITPNDKEIFQWMPVRKETVNGEITFVSEWEGYDLDKAGYMKQDLLSLKNLDKISMIFNSIKEKTGKVLKMETIPLNDPKTYEYFAQGYNEDVFQFGAKGLSQYTKQLKPDNINDIISTVALYRPGSIDSGFHMEYILLKNGEKEPEYIEGCEDITHETYGLYVFQEQIMFLCQRLGDFNLDETDDIRKGLGKKQLEIIVPYKDKFIENSQKHGFAKKDAEEIWKMIERFSGYSFCLAHAACYGITGYITQYLKVNYPIHFWTTAFTFAKDDEIAGYISEIQKTGDIKITPPNINISGDKFTTNFKNNSIAWSLTSIKGVGEKAVEEILRIREEKKEYFSFEEFFFAHNQKGSKVNKTVIEHLILAGAFDEIEGIVNITDRKHLIEQYRKLAKTKIAIKTEDWFEITKELHSEFWFWLMQQKALSGFAIFDYNEILTEAFPECDSPVLNVSDILSTDVRRKEKIKIGGYVTEVNERSNKKMGTYCNLVIEHNYTFINVLVKSNIYESSKEMLLGSVGKLLLMTGETFFDSYKQVNAVQTNNESEIIVLE